MIDQDRSELQSLKQEQSRLEAQMGLLRHRLQTLEQRIAQTAAAPSTSATSAAPSKPLPTAANIADIPPIIPKQPAQPHAVEALKTAFEKPSTVSAPLVAAVETPAIQVVKQSAPVQPPPPVSASKTEARESSFEMRLGTYWLVRVGIVMVLTALVFFGNLAYHNFISKLGAGGKVALLYIASCALLGAGAFWMRRTAQTALKNYAQVLFAGGLAGVYFTTFAAHHFPNLRIIQSPVVDGGLLLAWAGFMAWIADRRKSEPLALFAVGLAYYTSIITRVGYFTLYSNLLLTAAAVFFLVRNRWATMSAMSLAATYGSYAFWRFFHAGRWGWPGVDATLWHGAWILVGYWLLFTAAVFLARSERMQGSNRAAFLTFNNGAFLASFLLTMVLVREGGLWRVLLIFGAVLLGLAYAAGRLLREDPLARNAYLTQGLVLVTLGVIAKFSGLQLALMLGGESVILLVLAQQRRDPILLAGAYISAALAVGWGMDGFQKFDRKSMYLGIGLMVMMFANTVLTHRAMPANDKTLRPEVCYFAALGLLVAGLVTWHNTTPQWFAFALSLEALAFTLSLPAVRIKELAALAQGLAIAAVVSWMENRVAGAVSPPWWNTLVVIGVLLGLSHWWQRQQFGEAFRQASLALQCVYSLAIVGLVFWWMSPQFSSRVLLVYVSALAVGLTAYGAFTRLWPLAAFAQLLFLPAIGLFIAAMVNDRAEWYQAVTPMMALVLLAAAAKIRLENADLHGSPWKGRLLQLSVGYRWVALLMSLWWITEYIPGPYRAVFAVALGAAAFAYAGRRAGAEWLLVSAVYLAFGIAHICLPPAGVDSVSVPNLVAILGVLGLQRAARAWPERYVQDARVHTGAILVGSLSLWLFVSRWVLETQSGFYLTASWSVLALLVFSLGFFFREKVYRWLGLGILACALGRVVIFDVWRLQTVYRILSFLALGIVLLVLGYMYSRFQEKIRQWL